MDEDEFYRPLVSMSLFLLILFFASALGGAIFFALGITSLHAMEWVHRAIGFVKIRDYEAARKAILRAVRLNPKLRQHQDLVKLYESIVSGNDAIQIAEQVESNIPNWPKAKLESFYQDPSFKFILYGFIAILLIIKLLNM